MISKIEETYNSYIDIYERILPTLTTNDDLKAKILLENSLYLSVFTIFESFLKDLINNYVDNIQNKGISFSELTEGFAQSIFLSHEKRIMNIFTVDKDKSKTAFSSYFKLMNENLPKEILRNHIKFEFLHESKLNTYYKNLFLEILGDSEFLSKICLTEDEEDYGGLLDKEISSDANKFLSEYTNKVRNNIAHENDRFSIGDYASFRFVVNAFTKIIKEMAKSYEQKTGFKLEDNLGTNLLDEFTIEQ